MDATIEQPPLATAYAARRLELDGWTIALEESQFLARPLWFYRVLDPAGHLQDAGAQPTYDEAADVATEAALRMRGKV